MENKQDFLKTKPIPSLLISMSLPMIFSMLIQSLYNIIDSIYVSHLGTQALTAVSLAFPLQNIVVSVAVGFGVGISSVLSISLGEENQKKANEAATIGMVLSVVHCLLFVLLGIFITKPFLSLFTTDAAVFQDASSYTYIVLCASAGCLLQVSMEKIYQGIGNMKTAMVFLSAGCFINIVLDPILIFGLLGAPAMGVKGAAIATVIGQSAAFLLYVISYLRKNPGVHIHPSYFSWDKKLIKRIYAVGIPASLMMMMPSLLVSVLNGMLMAFSEVYVAVLGIYFKLQTFLYMPANGIVQGMRPMIGYNYGAGEYKRVKQTVRYGLVVAEVIMVVGTILSLLIPEQILSLFKAEEELLTFGVTALRIISLGFAVSGVGIIFCGVFEALGRGKDSLMVSLLRQFVITIPLGFLLSRILGPVGIWIAFPAAELIASTVSAVLLKKVEKGCFFPL
ncbi:MAG: MATE family efflux transporter [Lachnospiraceae bacterium]